MAFSAVSLLSRFLALVGLLLSSVLGAHPLDLARPDAHAPISVMGDHMHHAGEVMVSYRYMYMEMAGLRQGSEPVTADDVLGPGDAGYVVTPVNMQMQMHMVGIMWAPMDSLTLMSMIGYQDARMEHLIAFPGLINANGGDDRFTTRAHGLTDWKLTVLVRLYENHGFQLHTGLGISLPTGATDVKDTRPVPGEGRVKAQLPASMQPGSGTSDLLPSLTAQYQQSWYSLGTQLSGVYRTHKNDEGYALGDEFRAQVWGAIKPLSWMSFSGRVGYHWQDDLQGEQKNIARTPPPMAQANGFDRTVTTAFSQNYGGEQVDAGFGINFYLPGGILEGNRFASELTLPIYRERNGIQLETDWVLTVGWQYSW